MATSNISELYSLPFNEIISAPLLAMIQGESQAAQATVEFIQEVGFIKDTNDPDDAFGDLRMVTFRYTSNDLDGNLQEKTIEVPLLSIVPIPMMQIKEGEIEFGMKITDIEEREGTAATVARAPVESALVKKKVTSIKGAISDHPQKISGETTLTSQMSVKMKVGQADIPAGLSSVFTIMENTIKEQE